MYFTQCSVYKCDSYSWCIPSPREGHWERGERETTLKKKQVLSKCQIKSMCEVDLCSSLWLGLGGTDCIIEAWGSLLWSSSQHRSGLMCTHSPPRHQHDCNYEKGPNNQTLVCVLLYPIPSVWLYCHYSSLKNLQMETLNQVDVLHSWNSCVFGMDSIYSVLNKHLHLHLYTFTHTYSLCYKILRQHLLGFINRDFKMSSFFRYIYKSCCCKSKWVYKSYVFYTINSVL